MAKKDKPKVDKIVKKVNKEFAKTSSHIESLITDALKQFDSLQSQIQDPVRKLCKEIDELRDREMKRFNDEFERRLQEFQELQNSLLDRLGIAHSDSGKSDEKAALETDRPASKKPVATEAPKTAVKAKAQPKAPAKAKVAEKAPTKAKAKATKLADTGDLTRIKGIGPATQKKMKEAGLNSIGQIAYPSAEDQEKLQAFTGIKGFAQLSSEAKKIV